MGHFPVVTEVVSDGDPNRIHPKKLFGEVTAEQEKCMLDQPLQLNSE